MKSRNSFAKKFKLNNSGISLVEILVILAIVVLLAGIGMTSWAIVKNADVSKSTQNIVTYYEKLKTYTMSKTGEWRMEISRDDSDMYYAAIYCYDSVTETETMDGDKIELGKYIDIYYKDEADGEKVRITKNAPLNIRLKTSTGSVNKITLGNSVKYDSAGSYTSSYGTVVITYNDISDGNINIYYITGKVVKD